jgi:hypothetical protein
VAQRQIVSGPRRADEGSALRTDRRAKPTAWSKRATQLDGLAGNIAAPPPLASPSAKSARTRPARRPGDAAAAAMSLPGPRQEMTIRRSRLGDLFLRGGERRRAASLRAAESSRRP